VSFDQKTLDSLKIERKPAARGSAAPRSVPRWLPMPARSSSAPVAELTEGAAVGPLKGNDR
jgi:hypothetical protein